MKKQVLFALMAAATLSLQAQDFNLNEQYRQLDDAISHSQTYVAKRMGSIDSLKTQLAKTTDNRERFRLTSDIYDLYHPFINDSALHYAGECVTLAERTGDETLAQKSRLKLAYQCASSGMYQEAMDIVDSIGKETIQEDALPDYYHTLAYIYGELAYYTALPMAKEHYASKHAEFTQRFYENAPADDDRVLQFKEIAAVVEGDRQKAVAINDQRMQSAPKGSHRYAIVSFYRHLISKLDGDEDKALYWLTESAISDAKNAVMDQGSLWELANQLQAKGDLDRSYRYISFASDCANRFGTRVRNWQISPVLLNIDKNYQEQNVRQKQQLRLLLGIISLLAVGLLASLFFVIRQRQRLAQANQALSLSHQELETANQELEQTNRHLEVANRQLEEANAKLADANGLLSESNRMKEEYVGRFLRMCSLYIDRMDQMRKNVNRHLKNREYEELYQMTRPQDQKDEDLNELLDIFDHAFLKLFPNFVKDFNALLKPEEQIVTPGKDALTTVVRIFALIRLGIEDSSKIAEFLHYSVNTIYNYRARIKNGALHDRDNFENQVKQIGM